MALARLEIESPEELAVAAKAVAEYRQKQVHQIGMYRVYYDANQPDGPWIYADALGTIYRRQTRAEAMAFLDQHKAAPASPAAPVETGAAR